MVGSRYDPASIWSKLVGMSPLQFLEGFSRIGCQMTFPELQCGQQPASIPSVWMLESGQYGLSQQPVIPQPFLFVSLQGPTISPARASQNRYAPVSPYKMEVDKELSLHPTMVQMSESARGQAYIGHLLDASTTRSKGKEKAREPS